MFIWELGDIGCPPIFRSPETLTVNSKATTIKNNLLQSRETMTSAESRYVTTDYDPDTLVTESVSVPGLFDTFYGYDNSG